jgi:hypothetical protein
MGIKVLKSGREVNVFMGFDEQCILLGGGSASLRITIGDMKPLSPLSPEEYKEILHLISDELRELNMDMIERIHRTSLKDQKDIDTEREVFIEVINKS